MGSRASRSFGSGPSRCALCFGLLATLLSTGWGQLPQATPESSDVPPVATQIALWVRQLNDDSFTVRTNATDKLVLAGPVAIGPVSKAVEKGNLEVASRAIYVLRELALGLDVDAQEQGAKALRELAGSERKSAARLARDALRVLGKLRQQQTVEQLGKLGAVIRGFQPTPFTPFRRFELEIGPEWKGSRKDLQRLRWLPDLYKITLIGPRVDDSWIEMLRDIESLNYIAIKNAQITDHALLVISQMKTVVSLDLMYSPVTDAGFAHLRKMKNVRMIRCYGTNVTAAAADRFQADLANVEVDFKMGAFLGVSCQQAPWPCTVQRVTDQSAAQKAGVQVGDIIVAYAKKAVTDFDDLKRLIARNKVGDTVEIRIARGGSPVIRAILHQPNLALGIEGEPVSLGVKVKKVKADGAAAKAGVRTGDLIVAFDSERITNIDQLQKVYQKGTSNRPGRIQILRDVNVKTVKVTFGEWNEDSYR